MNKAKVLKVEYIGLSEGVNTYKLFTGKKFFLLNISNEDTQKKAIIDYINCPFYIITSNNINDVINADDYFEVSTCETTLDLECNSSCGVNSR